MFPSPSAGESADSLSALSPGTGRSEFPFPSRGYGRPISRRSSTASSVHSVGGALDTAASTVHEASQNAISTLLQPPIVRTGLQPHTSAPIYGSHKPPTARDIPPVTLTNINHVDPKDFVPYLSQVGALYEQLRKVKESEDETAALEGFHGRNEEPADRADGHLRPGSRGGGITRKSSSGSLSSLNTIEPRTPTRRTSSGYLRKTTQGPPPLSTIPTVYFDEEFRLENPRTFDVVSERSEVIRSENAGAKEANGNAPAPRKALATNAILQEKLSWYMDTIEVHLINSISTASTTFFTALGSLKELHSEAAESVKRIKALRKELNALDEEVATSGMQIALKRRRENNLSRLNNAVLQLRKVTEALVDCENLVDAGELDKALAGIDSLERLIAGERAGNNGADQGTELWNLRSASALRGISTDLDTLRFRIGKAYESQFADVLLADLRRHVDNVSPQEVLLRWNSAAVRVRGGHARSPSVFPTYLTQTEELRTQIMPAMMGLHRAKHVSTAALAYREMVLREVKNLIRRPLPSSSDDDNESMMSVSTAASGNRQRSNQEKSSILARNLRALEPEDAEELLRKVYIGVTETLRRLSTQVKVLLDVASSLSEGAASDVVKSPPVRSPVTSPRPDRHSSGAVELQEELHKTLNIGRLQDQAVDVSNEKIVKVLKVRSEQTIRLPRDFFLRYFTLNLYFANECEAISGKSSTILKNVVNSHIRDFVQKHGEVEMKKLAQGMEADQWNAKDFSPDHSELLQHVLEASDHDASSWSERTKIWLPIEEVARTNDDTTEEDSNGTTKKETRAALIDEERFILPNSAVLLLDGISSFLRLIAGIPSMATDIASSLVAYLQLFNSRCTQLILGAGATKSARLKNITTKHLSLASQALAFTVALVPHVREFVRRHAGSAAGISTLMGEFDKVRRLLQEHQDSIHQKLVDIMSGRAAVHSKAMRNIDWDSSPGPHPYMETLAKETTTLHKVLVKHLPEPSIQMVMVPVFSSYREQLGEALKAALLRSHAGQESMLADMELFSDRMGKLGDFGDAAGVLMAIAKSKAVETDNAPATTAKANDRLEEAESNSERGAEGGDQKKDQKKEQDTPVTDEPIAEKEQS